jgi:integrase
MAQGIVLKNFLAIKKMYRGYVVYELIDHDGNEFVPFSIFQRDFIDAPTSHSASTIKTARTAVAKFLDYMAEVESFNGEYNSTLLRFVVNQYPDFLADKINSENELLKSAHDALKNFKPELNTVGSHNSHITYVNAYLELSEKIAREAAEILAIKAGLSANDSYEALFPAVWELKPLSQKEKNKFAQTKIGGCIKDTGKLILKPSKILGVSGRLGKKVAVAETERAFPVEEVDNLIQHTTSKRNRAIFAVLACLGLRISEVLQLRWSDIDFLGRDIQVRPATPAELAKANIPEEKHNSILSWKGRRTANTMPIAELEPLMYRCLYEYQKSNEYKTSPNHEFIFVFTKGERVGQPLLQIVDVENNSVSILITPFKSACRNAVIEPPHISGYLAYVKHDLRHGYGTYMRNSAPRTKVISDSKGDRTIIVYGFPLADVSKFMGHASLESTNVYAKRTLASSKASHIEANAILESGGNMNTRIIALATYYTKMRNSLISQIESPEERAKAIQLIEGKI